MKKILLSFLLAVLTLGTASAATKFKLVESSTDFDPAAEYLIVSSKADGTAYAMQMNLSSKHYVGVEVTIANKEINLETIADGIVMDFVASTTANKYYIHSTYESKDKYVKYNGSSTDFSDCEETTTASLINVAIESSNNAATLAIAIDGVSRYIKFYSNKNDFRAYTTSDGSTVFLFKKDLPAEPCAITWMADGSEFATSTILQGESVVLPTSNPTAVGELSFVGWTNSNTVNASGENITWITNTTKTPHEANTTFYAVYAKQSMGTVTVTQEAKKKEDLSSPFGESGVGTDYADSNAPYQIKLDNTGDYITFDAQGKTITNATINWKMIGGTSTSTIKLQENIEGTTFTDVQSYSISGAQNATGTGAYTQEISGVKTIRWHFTKGSNVGVNVSVTYKETALTNSNFTTTPSAPALTSTIFTFIDGVLTSEHTTNQVAKNANGEWAANYIELDDNGFDLPEGIEIKTSSAKYTRTFPYDGWQSICLPFSGNVSDFVDGDHEVAELSAVNYDNGTYTLAWETVSTIEAHKAYIIRPVAAGEQHVGHNTSETTISGYSQHEGVDGGDYTFQMVGTYSNVAFGEFTDEVRASMYVMNQGNFYHPGKNATLKPFRAYLVMVPKSQSVLSAPAMIRMTVDGEEPATSGISEIEIDFTPETINADNAYYDMLGRRVDNPAAGFYIHNGKKVFVK